MVGREDGRALEGLDPVEAGDLDHDLGSLARKRRKTKAALAEARLNPLRVHHRAGPVQGTGAQLTREGLVDRELLYVRRRLGLNAGGFHGALNPGLKGVERFPRLPEIDHAPALVDRPGGVVQKSLWRI